MHAAPRRSAAGAWRIAAHDPDPNVRRRAAELAPALGTAASPRILLALLADAEPLVAESAAFALGEHPSATPRVIAALGRAAGTTTPSYARPRSPRSARSETRARCPAVLAACDDKPAVRRRAVLALAAFESPQVEQRLKQALEDRDWQTRQAAEDLARETIPMSGPSSSAP